MSHTDRSEDELLAQARQAMSRAYAPYSDFRVGAVLEASDGRCFSGCNVENASYPVTVCAERVALGSAVAAGARDFRRIVIRSSGEGSVAPCGMCRQALWELAPDLTVVSVSEAGERETWRLRDLLPAGFRLADGTDG